MHARQDSFSGPLQVQAQMQAMQEQMQRPEVQEQMKEAQALMQDKGFAEKVEKLKVSWLALLRCCMHMYTLCMHHHMCILPC